MAKNNISYIRDLVYRLYNYGDHNVFTIGKLKELINSYPCENNIKKLQKRVDQLQKEKAFWRSKVMYYAPNRIEEHQKELNQKINL